MIQRDVQTMVRTTQAARRWRHVMQCALAGAFVGVVWALFLWAMWRAV